MESGEGEGLSGVEKRDGSGGWGGGGGGEEEWIVGGWWGGGGLGVGSAPKKMRSDDKTKRTFFDEQEMCARTPDQWCDE